MTPITYRVMRQDDAGNKFGKPERGVSKDLFYRIAVMAGQIRHAEGMHV